MRFYQIQWDADVDNATLSGLFRNSIQVWFYLQILIYLSQYSKLPIIRVQIIQFADCECFSTLHERSHENKKNRTLAEHTAENSDSMSTNQHLLSYSGRDTKSLQKGLIFYLLQCDAFHQTYFSSMLVVLELFRERANSSVKADTHDTITSKVTKYMIFLCSVWVLQYPKAWYHIIGQFEFHRNKVSCTIISVSSLTYWWSISYSLCNKFKHI
jgi:hypothetical protein